MRWGIIGAGLIGGKRAAALKAVGETVAAVADLDGKRAAELAAPHGASSSSDWRAVTADPSIEAVVVATTHDALSPISVDALKHGKHVLVEKPAGRTPSEVEAIAQAAQAAGKSVAVGFNHRFHPAILEAARLSREKPYGRLMYMRARYGHGGRPGYEKEWRFKPEVSGGGQLIDQGSHLIDLARLFAGGDLRLAHSVVANHYWKAPAEDTGHLLLIGAGGVDANLSTSCATWKNLFSFELYFERAQANIDGLGRSYGTETLTLYKMKPEMGPPDTEVRKFEGADESWALEIKDFLGRIRGLPAHGASISDAHASLSIVAEAYRRAGRPPVA